MPAPRPVRPKPPDTKTVVANPTITRFMNLGPFCSAPPLPTALLRITIQSPKIVGPNPMSTLMNHGGGRNKEYPYEVSYRVPLWLGSMDQSPGQLTAGLDVEFAVDAIQV